MLSRKHVRYEVLRKIRFDLFAASTGAKKGYITNISQGGCLLKTTEAIDMRRWLRLVIHDPKANVCFTAVGRVTRKERLIEIVSPTGLPEDGDVTLYRYGVEFTYPTYFSLDPALILALSSSDATVRSCLTRNSKSSLREGFLA